jgi:hypothetical protein
MNIHNSQSTLHRILDANATFCATSGLFSLLAAGPLADFLNTTQFFMTVLAVGLFSYATFTVYNASQPVISRGFTLFTVIVNSTWVLASILLLILPIFHFTPEAKWAIGIIAICVDVFATIQFLEWRKM